MFKAQFHFLEQLSGVKAHTIRIWEKRYGIIPNRRSETNTRYYLDEDLQTILNIAVLNKNGLKISSIAKMSPEQIRQKVANHCEVDEVFEDQIDGLMLAMIELNEYKFLKIINHYIEVRGFEKTMSEVLYPFLDKLSIMWVTGSVRGVHESFVTSIIQRKLCYEIDRLASEPKDVMKRFLIYLPENEGHELSLLFLYYILRSRGANVLFLGSNTPLAEVLDGYQIFNPDFIFTLINDSFADIPLQPYLDKLSAAAPNAIIGISGYQTMTQELTPTQNVKVFSSLHEIVTFIEANICRK